MMGLPGRLTGGSETRLSATDGWSRCRRRQNCQIDGVCCLPGTGHMRRDCRSCGVLYPRLPARTFSSMDLPAPLGPTTATEPVPPHKDTTAWLGKSDSNSEMLSQSTLLKSRADFLRFS